MQRLLTLLTLAFLLCSSPAQAGLKAVTNSGGGGGGGSGTVSIGSTGQVPFYASTGTTVIGTSTLNVSGGLVGIGTATPTQLLSVGVSSPFTVNTSGNIVTSGTYTGPTIIGGTTASSTLTLESTSGAGTTDSIIFKTGSQVTAMTISTTSVAPALNVNLAAATLKYQIANGNAISFPNGDFGQVAIGSQALGTQVTNSARAIAIGFQALENFNSSNGGNIAIGYQTLTASSLGAQNTMIGDQIGGSSFMTADTCVGALACAGVGGSARNTGIGVSALNAWFQGGAAADNTAVGYQALIGTANAAGGSKNTGIGSGVLKGLNAASTNSSNNTAMGYQAGASITSGSSNTLLGYLVGSTTLTTGTNNILIGTNSGVDAQSAGASNAINIGNLIYGTGIGTSGTVSTGSVGIGTATILNSSKLHVNGTIETGLVGSTLGSVLFAGSTSGLITEQPQAAAGTYNWNLPITPGTAGQVLTSQAGGSTAMTWSTAATGSGGTPTCGTGCASITAGSTDLRGSMVSGSSVSSVTLNFSGTLASAPFCTISDSNTTATADISSISTSALTVSLASALTSVTIYWNCPL